MPLVIPLSPGQSDSLVPFLFLFFETTGGGGGGWVGWVGALIMDFGP